MADEYSLSGAAFNFGIRKGHPERRHAGVEFFPVELKPKYVPPVEDVDKVIAQADPVTQDYLMVLRDTLARIGEINALTWDDVNSEGFRDLVHTQEAWRTPGTVEDRHNKHGPRDPR